MEVNKFRLLPGVLLLISFVAIPVQAFESSTKLWKWECLQTKPNTTNKCVKVSNKLAAFSAMSRATCQLICGPYGSLMPRPQEVTLSNRVAYFFPSQITKTTKCENNVCDMLSEALSATIITINKYHPMFEYGSIEGLWAHPKKLPSDVKSHSLIIEVAVSKSEEHLVLATDESYTIRVHTQALKTKVKIAAPTYFGARHALETLTQLMDYDEDRNCLQIVSSAMIRDRPSFAHRGLLIDTSRNFLPINKLKHIIDAMSYNKLNTFHWHISDTQSFPLEIKAYPKMAMYGTYSPSKVYTTENVKDLVHYARIRGIKILPELDVPAHVGNGWQWGEEDGMGNLVVCLDQQPWESYCQEAPCGQLNLANPKIYTVLRQVYKAFIEMFGPLEMFHFGGDEVNINCWNSSKEVSSWMVKNNFALTEDSYHKQWSIFQEKAKQLLTDANGGQEIPGILWTSSLTAEGRVHRYLDPAKYIIQIWTKGTDPVISEILKNKFQIIMSNYDALYLDCGTASWMSSGNNWCSPYKGWQTIYDNDIQFIVRNLTGSMAYDQQLLGAEATAWSEQIDEHTIDAKLWPRGSAFAERLWSNPKTNYSFAEHRMLVHRERLVSRGIGAERLQPEWCLHHEGECRLNWLPPADEPKDQCETMAIAACNGIALTFTGILEWFLHSWLLVIAIGLILFLFRHRLKRLIVKCLSF